MQQKAFIKLLSLQYNISYKKGLENTVVDALSCMKQGTKEDMLVISSVTPRWLEIVVEGYQNDEEPNICSLRWL